MTKMNRHQEVKAAARERFNKVIKKAMADIQAREKVFVSIRAHFEMTPYLYYFNTKIKDELFHLIFNQQLYAYLGKRLEEMRGMCRL